MISLAVDIPTKCKALPIHTNALLPITPMQGVKALPNPDVHFAFSHSLILSMFYPMRFGAQFIH